MKLSRKSKFFLKIALSILLLYVIFKFVNINSVLKNFEKINYSYIAYPFLFLLLRYFFSALSIWILLIPFSKIKFFKFMMINTVSIGLGYWTPAQTGEASIVFFLKKIKVESKQSFAIFTFNKLISVIIILIMGLIGLKYFGYGVIGYATAAVVFLTAYVVTYPEVSKKIGKVAMKLKFIKRFRDIFDVVYILVNSKRKYIFLNLLTNTVKFLCTGIMVYYSFKVIGLHVPYFLTVFVILLAKIPTFIPVSFAGLGILESGGVYFFHQLGFNSADVLAGLFLNRLIVVASVILILVFGVINYKKLIHKRVK